MTEPYKVENDDISLSCFVGDDNIIYISMTGNLGKETLHMFDKWGEFVKKAIRDVYKKNNKTVLTLVDAKGVREIDVESISKLIDFMNCNRDFITKTAIFGPNYFVKIIVELASHATNRNDMKTFDSREDAVAWLTS